MLLISGHFIQIINAGKVARCVSGENVMVHGCLPLSLPRLPSDSRQVHAGLVTDATLLVYAMAGPGATIGFPPSNLGQHLHGHHTCKGQSTSRARTATCRCC